VASGASSASALDELLSVEREIAAQAEAATRAAEALIAGARADATAFARDSAVALAAEIARLDAQAADRRVALIHSIEDENARLVARYQSLGDAEIAAIADFVVSEATGLSPGRAP
jgi:predicted component of type VI protein secretion system